MTPEIRGVQEGAKVTYTVKELLSEIRDDVKAITKTLEQKIDRSELTDLRTHFDETMARMQNKIDSDIETRIKRIEQGASDTEAVQRYKRFFWPLVVTASSSLALGIAHFVGLAFHINF